VELLPEIGSRDAPTRFLIFSFFGHLLTIFTQILRFLAKNDQKWPKNENIKNLVGASLEPISGNNSTNFGVFRTKNAKVITQKPIFELKLR